MGRKEVHDSIRGEGVFSKDRENLEKRGCRAYISFTISQLNRGCVSDLILALKGAVVGVTTQFYYPYSGLPDPLFISPLERVPILDQLIQLKQDGYPVADYSVASMI